MKVLWENPVYCRRDVKLGRVAGVARSEGGVNQTFLSVFNVILKGVSEPAFSSAGE